MHALMFIVLAGCCYSIAFYLDAESIIWMRSRHSKLAYSIHFFGLPQILHAALRTQPFKLKGLLLQGT